MNATQASFIKSLPKPQQPYHAREWSFQNTVDIRTQRYTVQVEVCQMAWET